MSKARPQTRKLTSKTARKASAKSSAPDKAPDKAHAADPATEAILRHWRESVPDDRIAHLIRDAARGVTRGLQLRLARHDVSFGHWVFLRILWAEDGLSQRELSDRAGLMESTTHTALRRMEEQGYVTRRNRPGNLRKQHVFLTPSGRALKKKLVPLAESVNKAATAGIDPADMTITRQTLLAMIVNLAQDEASAAAQGDAMPSTRSMRRRTS
ncbi:MAG: MarR family winged helix-turn-helix transcriptional regulator [Burkholderiaceae bacterium]